MRNKIFKDQKGIAGADALIAVLLIALFSGLIATISYNIFISNSSINRMSKATSYIVDVFEYVDKIYYDDVTKDNIVNYFNSKYYTGDRSEVKMKSTTEETVNTPYVAEINVTKYNQTEGNSGKLDLVEEITMRVTYKLGSKEQKVEMKKIKARENLITPNKPDLSLLTVEASYRIYPIKKVEDKWKVCNENDISWYNYEVGNWALVIQTQRNLSQQEEIDPSSLESGETFYAWIPRYAYNNTDRSVRFLYSNSDNYIETDGDYKKVVEVDSSKYTIPTDFSTGGKKLTGVWNKEETSDVFKNLNNFYPLKK